MKIRSIPTFALLLASAASAQIPVAPYGQPNSNLPGFSDLSGTGQSHRASVEEKFEAYSIGSSNSENINSLVLDDTTITGTGQGPGLVQDGVTYSVPSTAWSIQWCGNNYYGIQSKTILGNDPDGTLRIDYDQPQSQISFDMHAFNGFGEMAVVYVYDAGGALIFTSAPISIPNSSPVPFSYSGSNIGSVILEGTVNSWSPIIDDHIFGDAFTLSSTGVPGGQMTFDVVGATPNSSIALVYAFGTGSYSRLNPFTGNVVTTGLSSFGFALGFLASSDASGNTSYGTTVPAGAAGVVYVQAIDMNVDGTSNVIGL